MAMNYRGYDYGMRGFRDGLPTRFRSGPRMGGPGYDPMSDERAAPRFENRVTRRYNLDYVYGARGARPAPRNPNMYTGDRPDRMGDDRMYRQPYSTISGTRTDRGASRRTGYDGPDYGPDYGGRYPDELY